MTEFARPWFAADRSCRRCVGGHEGWRATALLRSKGREFAGRRNVIGAHGPNHPKARKLLVDHAGEAPRWGFLSIVERDQGRSAHTAKVMIAGYRRVGPRWITKMRPFEPAIDVPIRHAHRPKSLRIDAPIDIPGRFETPIASGKSGEEDSRALIRWRRGPGSLSSAENESSQAMHGVFRDPEGCDVGIVWPIVLEIDEMVGEIEIKIRKPTDRRAVARLIGQKCFVNVAGRHREWAFPRVEEEHRSVFDGRISLVVGDAPE